jgi:hypothetical protein
MGERRPRTTEGPNPLAQRIAAAVGANGARVRCFACLAAQHRLNEHDVRAVALVLVTRTGLDLVPRVCVACGRVEETVVQRAAA